MFKKSITSFLVAMSLVFPVSAKPFEISGIHLQARTGIQLFHDENGFVVKDIYGMHTVKAYNIDDSLRNISSEKLIKKLGADKFQLVPLTQEQAAKIDMTNAIEMTEAQKELILSNIGNPGYIAINQNQDGDYILQMNHRIIGGGGLGAIIGAIGGKFLVHAVAGAVATVVGLGATLIVGPVAGPAIGYGLWGVMAPTVEVASNVVAMASGIALGSATGPV